MENNKKIFYWLVAPVIAFVFLVARVYPVLPAVMQDEYIYSSESRHIAFADQNFPNYLFSFVYQSTSACGLGFYPCAKNLNILFFIVLLVFVYLIASRLLGRGYAIAAVTLTILSPIGESISFFMPETMYFTFMVVSIWATLKAAQKGTWVWWLFAGSLLGLTTLTKPHALFAVPVIVLFALFISKRTENGTWVKGLVNSLIVLSSTLVLKFGLGFAFAGPAGLTLFGRGYSGSVQQFVTPTAGSSGTVGQTTSSPTMSITESQDPWALFTSVSGFQLLMHFTVLLVIWGIPAMLSFSVIKNVLVKRDKVSDLGAFVSLAGSLAIAYAIVVAVFEGFVTAMGDDHSRRVITRYYDFLIPLLLIITFAVHKYVEPKLWVRVTQTVFVVASAIWLVAYFPTGVDPKIADSIPLMGLLFAPWVGILVAVVVVGMQLFWLFSPERGAKALSFAVIPTLVVVIGLAAQGSLLAKIGSEKAYFDIAGQTARDFLTDVDGSKIIVVGGSRPEVVTAKFWIDKANIKELLAGQDGLIQLSALQGNDYALFLGSNQVDGIGQTVTSGDKFVLIKLTN